MRNFVRPQSAEVEPRPVEFNALIGEVQALCESELAGADVDLRFELTTDASTVAVDSIRIQQVLVNLVQNAVQALKNSPRDDRRLTIRTSMYDGELCVEAIDNGPGFAADDPEAVFAPFYTTRSEGLGMGLSISRGIVEEHGGRLWAANHPDGGAIVGFTLPANRNDGASASEHGVHSLCR
jgi:C4-dicarboxylate-specific signal transduction histidine kinase